MKEYNRKILANNIKQLRSNKGLKQADLAKIMHVSQQTVGAWETGRTIPGSDTLDALADFFEVNTDDLLGRSKVKITDDDLNTMLDNADSYDGKPMTDHDRALIKQYLKVLYSDR